DPEPILGQVALPIVDRFVPALPDMMPARLGRELLAQEVLRVHPDDQHLLVVRPIEDADLAARWQPFLVAAQEVLVELERRGDLEALYPHALRVEAAHHVADRPVLACRIERLKHNHDAVRVLSSEPRLVIHKELDPLVQQGDPVLLPLDPSFERGIEVLRQIHPRARADSEGFNKTRDSSRCVVGHPSTLTLVDAVGIGAKCGTVAEYPLLATRVESHRRKRSSSGWWPTTTPPLSAAWRYSRFARRNRRAAHNPTGSGSQYVTARKMITESSAEPELYPP